MRILIVLISLLTLSCSPPIIQVKRHWDKIQELVLKHPELADSLGIVKRDTLRSDSIQTRIAVTSDPGSWDSSMFGEVDSLVREIVVLKTDTVYKIKTIVKLQGRICPDIQKDSTYHLKVYNSQISLWIPIHLTVKAHGGALSIDIMAEAVQIPEPHTTTEVQFKSEKQVFYKDQWFWMFSGLIVLLAFAISRRLR